MNPLSLFYYSLCVFSVAAALMLLCLGLCSFWQKLSKNPINPANVKSTPAFYFMSVVSVIAALGILGMGASGIWYALQWIAPFFTPGILATVSIAIGVFPFVVGMLASMIAQRLDCQLSSAGVSECKLWGRDIGPLLYSMFMFTWMTIFTMGFAIFGVIGSIIWAFAN